MNARLKDLERRRQWLLDYSATQRELIVISGAAINHRFSQVRGAGQLLRSRRASVIAGVLVVRWAAKKLVGWVARRWLTRRAVRGDGEFRRSIAP